MRDSKKALISTAVVLFLFVFLSGCFLMITSPYIHNYDWQLREQLAGSLDFLIVGASHGQRGLYTREIDSLTGSNSYNLCYDCERNYERKYLLSKELSRNHIKTVVLELSYDTLQLSEINTFTDASIFSTMRMDSFSDQMKYFFRYVSADNMPYVYASMMYSGLTGFIPSRNYVDEEKADLKGSILTQIVDVRLQPETVLDAYNKDKFSVSDIKQTTVDGFTELIELCHNYDTRVIVAVIPVSDNYLWCHDDLDDFLVWAQEYCADNNVEFYDFNLLKNRYDLFSDLDCYSDPSHLSEKGSGIFTPVFVTIIQEASNGKDVSGYFYSSYEELKNDSPYMQIYNSK